MRSSQWNLEVLGSKHPKLRTLNPSGAWLPKMLMDSRKLEQRTSPWAAGCFLGLITTLVAASVSMPKLLSDFRKNFLPWWGSSIYIWLSIRVALWVTQHVASVLQLLVGLLWLKRCLWKQAVRLCTAVLVLMRHWCKASHSYYAGRKSLDTRIRSIRQYT